MAFSFLRRKIEESRNSPTVSPPTADVVERQGWVPGVPLGGATETNPAESTTSGAINRQSWMDQLFQAYLACPWSSACIDVIARTATAGGIQVVETVLPEGSKIPISSSVSRGVQKAQDLLDYVNPQDDIRQLMRSVITDLEIFGDSFTEVVWLMGEPVALYMLDPRTMYILADEHGVVYGYRQEMITGRTAFFEPHEVVHIQFTPPGGGLYGVSPTQKNILPITSWLFTAALVQETMRRGDPARLHVDWPLALPETEMKRSQQQFSVRNIGAKNIGNLFETKGGATVKELGVNQIHNWLSTLQQRRDEIICGYGTPPAAVNVIEAGNLGGGTGTAQERSFRVNIVGPTQEIVLEKFTFALLNNAFKVQNHHLQFGVVDWRDDETIEKILDLRIRNGLLTLNRGRAIIGEPSVDGGDQAVLVDRQNMTLWSDLMKLSAANVDAIKAKATPAQTPAPSTSPIGSSEDHDDDDELNEEVLRATYMQRRLAAMRNLNDLTQKP